MQQTAAHTAACTIVAPTTPQPSSRHCGPPPHKTQALVGMTTDGPRLSELWLAWRAQRSARLALALGEPRHNFVNTQQHARRLYSRLDRLCLHGVRVKHAGHVRDLSVDAVNAQRRVLATHLLSLRRGHTQRTHAEDTRTHTHNQLGHRWCSPPNNVRAAQSASGSCRHRSSEPRCEE